MADKKHVKYAGRLVFVGFGSVGQGTLPLLLRHVDMPRDHITIVTGDDRGRAEAEHYGITFLVRPLKRENYRAAFGPPSLGSLHFGVRELRKKKQPVFIELKPALPDDLQQLLALPEGHKVYCTLTLGYPRLKFLRAVDRKPIPVRWQ